MELSLIAIAIIVVIFIFRSPLKRTVKSMEKMTDYLNDSAIAIAIEGKKENTHRVIEAMKELEAMGGPVHFDELYNKACGKSVKEQK